MAGLYGTGLRAGLGLRNQNLYSDWSPTNLGSPSPNDYAAIMREIDQFNKLTREANHQTMMLEDEILDYQQKIYQVEIDSQKAREEMIRKMVGSDAMVSQPQPRSGSRGKPAVGPTLTAANANHAASKWTTQTSKPPTDSRARANPSQADASSLHTLIKDSIRTLPGVTEFVKNSELLDAFRKSYARDLQEYYKMNSSNLRRELIEKSDTPGLSSYSEATSQVYANSGAKFHKAAAHHNQTIKEADEQDEDGGRLNQTSKDTSRPASISTGRNKHTEASPVQPVQSKNEESFDQRMEQELEEKFEKRFGKSLKKDQIANEQPSKWAGPVDSPGHSQLSEKGGQHPSKQISQPKPSSANNNNHWLKEPESAPRQATTTTHKTTSLKEEDFATNFGQNDSASEMTPNVRTVREGSGEWEEGRVEGGNRGKRPGTTNLLDSGKKVKGIHTAQKHYKPGTDQEAMPRAEEGQGDTITFKPVEPQSHSGKKQPSERFTGNSDIDPNRFGHELRPKASLPQVGPQTHHVYKDSCWDASGFKDSVAESNMFHEQGMKHITESDLKKVKKEYEMIVAGNKKTTEVQPATESRKRIPISDEKLILEEDFGAELLTNPDIVGDASKSQAGVRHSKPMQEGSSLDYSHTRRFTEEGFRSNADQTYGTGTLGSRKGPFGNTVKGEPQAFQTKLNSELAPKNDRVLSGTAGSQQRSPINIMQNPSLSNNFGSNMPGINHFESPLSMNAFDRERTLPQPLSEIEKNYGFDASDISLVKKRSSKEQQAQVQTTKKERVTQKEGGDEQQAADDSRLQMFKDSALGYEEYLEKIQGKPSQKRTVLEPIEEKIVKKVAPPATGNPQTGVTNVQAVQYPSRRTANQSRTLFDSEAAGGSGIQITASKHTQEKMPSIPDSGVVFSKYPRSLAEESGRGEQYHHFDEELVIDDDDEEEGDYHGSVARGDSDALGRSGKGHKHSVVPLSGQQMANSLDDLEEYIEGSDSNPPYSMNSGEYRSTNRYSKDSGGMGSELHDDVFIDDNFEKVGSQGEGKHTGQGHSMSSQVEEEELSLSMGTRNPQGIFKNQLSKQVQRTNRYTGD